MYFEASTGHRPAWKRFEPALDVLQGAINDFQSIAKAVRQCPTGLDVTKRKRNSDGLQVNNKRELTFGLDELQFEQNLICAV